MHQSEQVILVEVLSASLVEDTTRVGSISYNGETMRHPLSLWDFEYNIVETIKGNAQKSTGSFVGFNLKLYPDAHEDWNARGRPHAFDNRLAELESTEKCGFVPIVPDFPAFYLITNQDVMKRYKVLLVNDPELWELEARQIFKILIEHARLYWNAPHID